MYSRILLKLSGECFCQEGGYGISPVEIEKVALLLKQVHDKGVQLAVVVGGGNIIRGAKLSEKGVTRHTADYMGMLGTLINAIALQDALEKSGVPTRVQTAISAAKIAEPFIRRRCERHLEKNRVVILAGGAGVPLFTTDTAAALRAKELEADVLLKATKVDGVFTSDPKKDPAAKKYDRLSYDDILKKNLRALDATAVALAREHQITIIVFNVKKPGNLLRIINGDSVGTIITSET
jgi:uridylate kinase